ncbi:DUF4089 domain-containing protein [Commensalibacter nepenthis]|uniref:DUF4089 domain-containing protein n=1 Tax=Commensalibacter nepenthis TaxID=3043872 RepID=A0ABT6Q4X1_9PROT|nr:DUF4089 domain-containing protein [Commensalibacter sp. TBRC 10068]MDI2111927.1 DUF4089 domain-containing protein [Commensalibacter sp. TBRC 10068]
MSNDRFYQMIQMLSDSINLTIPDECREGVQNNTKLLHQYSQLIHQFDIPEIEE